MLSDPKKTRRLFPRPWLVCTVTVTFLLLLTIKSQPIPQPEIRSVQQEKDSYEIYSLMLKTEMPPQSKVTSWIIQQNTQTFPGQSGTIEECLTIQPYQESIFRPLVRDYIARNKNKILLERKFDLPAYSLIEKLDKHSSEPYVTFQVSAVGFSSDGSHALVYVGHLCGSLCGGGRFHLLVKRDGHWQADLGFRGDSCRWVS
jgi:hypothetical protein